MELHRLVQHAREHAAAHPKAVGKRLATGQQPTVLFITCADSRIVTSAITGAEPGTVFELRTAGNVVPAYQPKSPSSEMATIEFAVVQLGVSEVIVCGHSHCGAVSALHGTDIEHLPLMRRWLSLQARNGGTATDPALREEGRRHVLAQLDRLRTYPFVSDRLLSGELRAHGWFYDIETGEVQTSADTAFQPL